MKNELEDILKLALGESVEIAEQAAVSGGCIADSRRVKLRDGQQFFVKSLPRSELPSGPSALEAEAAGLQAIAETNTLVAPQVIYRSATGEQEFLVLEWVEQGAQPPNFFSDLGVGLAHLHKADVSKENENRYGWHQDNFLGRSLQPNQQATNWCEFFATNRLGHQLQVSQKKHSGTPELYQQVTWICDHLSQFLGQDNPHPSLLHGDLWNGNFMCTDAGRPIVFDPAVYLGHREADLAMPLIFGGFCGEFWNAYEEVWPLESGFTERIELYKLYHYLNHLNLFGVGYLDDCLRISREFAPTRRLKH